MQIENKYTFSYSPGTKTIIEKRFKNYRRGIVNKMQKKII